MTEPEPLPPGWDAHVHVFDAVAPVRPGHYRPVDRPLAEIEALAARHGVGHLVLVQPSVYGCDNRVLRQALRMQPGRHRGVVVLAPDTPAAELQALHAEGVRGLRFNLVSPVGEQGDVAAHLRRLAPALREQGWHVQWYARPEQLAEIATLQAASGLPFVLDHLGGLHAGLPPTDPAWAAAQRLADAGAWLKLSGWYRLQAQAPYAELDPTLARAAALFGTRCVWGSDWPHTSFAPDQLPPYDSTWAPLPRVLGPERAARVRADQAQALYGG